MLEALILLLIFICIWLAHESLKHSEKNFHLKTELEIYKDFDKASRLANKILRERNCELVDQCNEIYSKLQVQEIPPGATMIPVVPGMYQISATCESIVNSPPQWGEREAVHFLAKYYSELPPVEFPPDDTSWEETMKMMELSDLDELGPIPGDPTVEDEINNNPPYH